MTSQPSDADLQVRPLVAQDLELICRHRREMFRDAGTTEDVLSVMTEHFRSWLRPRLEDGSYFGFVLTDNGESVASIGLMSIDWPPHPAHPSQAQRGYVLNLFVEPAHRRHGLGAELMRLAEAEFAERGLDFAILHATEKGQPLYEGLGWGSTAEMAKTIIGHSGDDDA
jgi:ribosomal protein S18 acetylase RimI-like enzyme